MNNELGFDSSSKSCLPATKSTENIDAMPSTKKKKKKRNKARYVFMKMPDEMENSTIDPAADVESKEAAGWKNVSDSRIFDDGEESVLSLDDVEFGLDCLEEYLSREPGASEDTLKSKNASKIPRYFKNSLNRSSDSNVAESSKDAMNKVVNQKLVELKKRDTQEGLSSLIPMTRTAARRHSLQDMAPSCERNRKGDVDGGCKTLSSPSWKALCALDEMDIRSSDDLNNRNQPHGDIEGSNHYTSRKLDEERRSEEEKVALYDKDLTEAVRKAALEVSLFKEKMKDCATQKKTQDQIGCKKLTEVVRKAALDLDVSLLNENMKVPAAEKEIEDQADDQELVPESDSEYEECSISKEDSSSKLLNDEEQAGDKRHPSDEGFNAQDAASTQDALKGQKCAFRDQCVGTRDDFNTFLNHQKSGHIAQQLKRAKSSEMDHHSSIWCRRLFLGCFLLSITLFAICSVVVLIIVVNLNHFYKHSVDGTGDPINDVIDHGIDEMMGHGIDDVVGHAIDDVVGHVIDDVMDHGIDDVMGHAIDDVMDHGIEEVVGHEIEGGIGDV